MIDVKFRDGAVIAVVRTALGITVAVREIGVRTEGGERVEYTAKRLPDITLRYEQLSDAVRAEAFGYGMEARLTRAAALSRDTQTNKAAPPAAKHEAIKRLADHYASGTEAWEMASSGGGGLSADTRVLIEALVRAFGLDAEVAEEQVRAMTTAERDAIRVSEEIRPVIAAIHSERAAGSKVDAGGLLERLRGLKQR